MKKIFWITAIGAGLLCAQTPDFSGVWKANAEKSKGIPPQGTYLAVITQKDGKLVQTNGITTPRGEQRSMYTWDLSGKETRGTLGGLPIESTAKYDGGALVVNAKQPNARTMSAKYSLSDPNTLLLEISTTGARGPQTQTLVLEKQPVSAGEALMKPEPTAAESGRYKNLKLLGSRPASSIGDTMQSISFALGQNCQFCHVQGDFASDDNPKKATARKMFEMTSAINTNFFGNGSPPNASLPTGRQAVRCFTCHQGSQHPPAPKL
jgi:hypothetical protein